MQAEEGEVAPPPYKYEGPREEGEAVTISVEVDSEADGEPSKVTKTKEIRLLGARSTAKSTDAGKAWYPNGDSYEGGFFQGNRHFQGKYTYANGVPAEDEESKPPKGVYEGVFKMGQKSGLGMMTYADGTKYHGEFKDGVRSGQGTCYYANGDIYSGQWVNGKKHGHGSYLYKETGAQLEGKWSAGAVIEGTFTDSFGGTYTGEFGGSATELAYTNGGKFVTPAGATVIASSA